MDRLADGADRLREILDRMARRHIARLEMHFGGAIIIAGNEAVQDFREKQPFLGAEPAHDAEVHRDQMCIRDRQDRKSVV